MMSGRHVLSCLLLAAGVAPVCAAPILLARPLATAPAVALLSTPDDDLSNALSDIAQQISDLQDQVTDLTQKRDKAVAELRQGRFCSKCMRAESEFDSPAAFSQHLDDVDGVPLSATPEQIAAKEKEYDDQIADLQDRIRELQQQAGDARTAAAQARRDADAAAMAEAARDAAEAAQRERDRVDAENATRAANVRNAYANGDTGAVGSAAAQAGAAARDTGAEAAAGADRLIAGLDRILGRPSDSSARSDGGPDGVTDGPRADGTLPGADRLAGYPDRAEAGPDSSMPRGQQDPATPEGTAGGQGLSGAFPDTSGGVDTADPAGPSGEELARYLPPRADGSTGVTDDELRAAEARLAQQLTHGEGAPQTGFGGVSGEWSDPATATDDRPGPYGGSEQAGQYPYPETSTPSGYDGGLGETQWPGLPPTSPSLSLPDGGTAQLGTEQDGRGYLEISGSDGSGTGTLRIRDDGSAAGTLRNDLGSGHSFTTEFDENGLTRWEYRPPDALLSGRYGSLRTGGSMSSEGVEVSAGYDASYGPLSIGYEKTTGQDAKWHAGVGYGAKVGGVAARLGLNVHEDLKVYLEPELKLGRIAVPTERIEVADVREQVEAARDYLDRSIDHTQVGVFDVVGVYARTVYRSLTRSRDENRSQSEHPWSKYLFGDTSDDPSLQGDRAYKTLFWSFFD
jgi:hypothetical protein